MQNFDKEGALARCDGDEDLLRELIQICIEDNEDKLKQIEAAGKTGDAAALQTAAHSMKSAMGNVGGMACHSILFELEKLGRTGSVEGYDKPYKSLIEKYELFKSEARKF